MTVGIRLMVMVSLMLMLGGCLTSPQQMQFQAQLNSFDKRLQMIEQQPAPSAVGGNRLNVIGRQQANMRADLDSLRAEVQTLSGRLDDQQHTIAQLRDEMKVTLDDLSLRVAALENNGTVKPTPTAPASPGATTPAAVATAATPPATSPVVAAATSTPAATSAAQLYKKALRLVQQERKFSAARNLFQQFVQQYPADKLTVNAMYWIGETYYGDKDYEKAILQFQDVIQKYPTHPKIPAALTKQGLAFYALGDVTNARAILNKVVASYPGTPEADKARKLLKSWK